MSFPHRHVRPVVNFLSICALGVAAGCDAPDPASPVGARPGTALFAWGPETPHFNLEVILRSPGGSGGANGYVKFRQPNDANRIVNLGVDVRDLDPNTSYSLQRATDAPDGACTSTSWLTLGKGAVPQAIVTDDLGRGREDLFRDLGATAVGSTFDIHFRVVRTGTTTVVLDSDCYQFTISQ